MLLTTRFLDVPKFTILTPLSLLTKIDRKQINVLERKVYRRILVPVYDNEKGNWRILTNK